jgi:hypothetical protein
MQKPTEPGRTLGSYERRDVNLRFAANVIVGLLLITLAGMAVSLWFFEQQGVRRAAAETPVSPLAATLPQQPPEPRLQVTPGVDYQKYRAEQEALLSSYAWIDSKNGIARIPIDRAIELLAERGLPARGAPPPGAAAPARKTGGER